MTFTRIAAVAIAAMERQRSVATTDAERAELTEAIEELKDLATAAPHERVNAA